MARQELPLTPTLVDAKHRCQWASEKAFHLRRQEAKVHESAGELEITFNATTFDAAHVPPPTFDWEGVTASYNIGTVRMMFSEGLHHLRCALDHVAFNLARLDSGTPKPETQFPIVDHPEKWEAEADRRLPGVHQRHRDIIREYQPFAGCRWTSKLRTLSNADKHRLLAHPHRAHEFTWRLDIESIRPHPTKQGLLLHAPGILEGSRLELPDGREPSEVLYPLHGEVSLLLFRLQELFGETDSVQLEEWNRADWWKTAPPPVPQ